MDDRGDSLRRRMAVVRHRSPGGAVRRTGAISGAALHGKRGGDRDCTVPEIEALLRAETALRAGAALLGDAAASGSVFIPLGAYDHGVCCCCVFGIVLSGDAGRVAVLRFERGLFQDPAGNAFPERCGCRRAAGGRVGVCVCSVMADGGLERPDQGVRRGRGRPPYKEIACCDNLVVRWTLRSLRSRPGRWGPNRGHRGFRRYRYRWQRIAPPTNASLR